MARYVRCFSHVYPNESVYLYMNVSKVSLEDFMATVAAQPLLIEAFGQCLPTDSAIVSFFSTLQV